MSYWHLDSIILIERYSMSYLRVSLSGSFRIGWFEHLSLSSSVNRFVSLELNFGCLSVMRRLSDLLSIDGSSWYSIVHAFGHVFDLNR